jgi:hypothetical protein
MLLASVRILAFAQLLESGDTKLAMLTYPSTGGVMMLSVVPGAGASTGNRLSGAGITPSK